MSEIAYNAFLTQAMTKRTNRRIQMALKTARLPVAKTIEDYDFSFHPKLEQKMVMELFDLTFVSRQENIIFLALRA